MPSGSGTGRSSRSTSRPSSGWTSARWCGTLRCCLRYEHDFSVQTRKRFPKEGRILRTAAGAERVLAVDIFRETVTLRLEGGDGDTRVVALEKLTGETARVEPPVA